LYFKNKKPSEKPKSKKGGKGTTKGKSGINGKAPPPKQGVWGGGRKLSKQSTAEKWENGRGR